MSIDTVESSRELAPGEPLLPGLLAWELLGGGSHCESWLAWSEDLWSPVVVKLPRPDEVSDAGVWEDLLLEVRAHEGVRHPGFQRLWRAELEAEVPHLVLEYVEGPSLATLRRGRGPHCPRRRPARASSSPRRCATCTGAGWCTST